MFELTLDQRATRERVAASDLALVRAFDAVSACPTTAAMAALRASLTAYVDDARARGASLSDVLSTLERVRGRHAGAGTTPLFDERLREWCTRAYRDDDWW